jgi:S-formylglutathione hydrolase FrmB
MGGYGAMKLALKFPDRFCSVVSHSGALAVASQPFRPELETELIRLFGPNPQGGPEDVFALAERLDPPLRPAIRFDCGVDDFLLQHNRDFHAHLNRLGLPHEYEEFPGGHSWDYWDLHIQEAIAFHARSLGLV